MLFCESILLRLFAVLLWVPAVPRPCRTLRVILPASKAFVLGRFAVWPVPHFGEGVRPTVSNSSPAILGPQGFCLRGLTGGGSLEPYWDALGWTGHQGDGLPLQVRARRWRHSRECKHLIIICAMTRQEDVFQYFQNNQKYNQQNVLSCFTLKHSKDKIHFRLLAKMCRKKGRKTSKPIMHWECCRPKPLLPVCYGYAYWSQIVPCFSRKNFLANF